MDTSTKPPVEISLFIDGSWTGGDGRSGEVRNPVNGELIGRVAFAGQRELEAATAAAVQGFHTWRHTPAVERARILHQAATLLRESKAQIAASLTAEQGKPLGESEAEIATSADLLDWFAEEGRRVQGKILPPRVVGAEQRVAKLPIGPVACFTPWNFPVSQAIRKLGPALATGCSVVVKPPENTPCSVAGLIRCLEDAGLPAGVVNMVFGVPSEISEFLIANPAIRKVSFTGSVPVGKHLASLAGQHMKPATMELGGHAPAIIFADADLDSAVALLVGSKFRNAGQVCVSPTRFLVERTVFEDVVADFAKRAESLIVGDGMSPETNMGPLVSSARREAVDTLVQDAIASGADLRTGGTRLGNAGNFYSPTVLANVSPSMRAMNEEPFGPVALFQAFDQFDEAVAEANRLNFGLAAYAFTADHWRAERLSEDIESGMVTINHLGLAVPEAHFGGIKESGYGSEGGSEALDAYLVSKFVTRSTPSNKKA